MNAILKGAKSATLALALATAAAAVSAAPVGQPINIQEGAILGALPSALTVDQLSGQYDEVISFTSPNNFYTEAIFNAGGWFLSGSPISSQVNGSQAGGLSNGYGLYAKFIGSGTFTGSVATGFTFNGASGAIEIYADPNQNTNYDVFTTTAGGGTSASLSHLNLVSGAASVLDDVLLGHASLVSMAQGNGTAGGLANGNFELVFSNFVLDAPFGTAYFTTRPFPVVLDLNGNFQSITPSAGQSAVILNNSANAFFVNAVPEPGALPMVALALLGLGAVTRRRNRKS